MAVVVAVVVVGMGGEGFGEGRRCGQWKVSGSGRGEKGSAWAVGST